MTVDASRSCLGLGTCVGSVTRQIVDARVLLTATAPPALPGSRMLDGSLAPPLGGTIPVFRSGCRHRSMPGDGPDKACQFPRDRSGDDIGRFAGPRQPAIAGAQPHLSLPGNLADRFGLVLLAQQQFAADPRREAVTPGDQQPAGRAVAGLGETAASDARTAECSDGTNPR
jgi:hypothetical protein